MTFNQIIAFCPRCGSDHFPEKSPGFFHCGACDFHFHPNCSVAVVAIIVKPRGEILLIRRNREPGKGKWSVPGGFVDAGETAEVALTREVSEEVGLQITDTAYLCSFPNPYEYKGVVFSVLDLVYVCRVSNGDTLTIAPDEVGEPVWIMPGAINLDEVAFPSVRQALALFRKNHENHFTSLVVAGRQHRRHRPHARYTPFARKAFAGRFRYFVAAKP